MVKAKRKFTPPPKQRPGVTEVISVSMPADMVRWIEAQAARMGTDRSKFIREAVEYVKREAMELEGVAQ